jgi:succinate dehydrogenase / fumarate reductase cytochrome b subunit
VREVLTLYRSTVGKKLVVAVTGLLLLLFVIGHMAGNLKVFQGPEKFDAYARFLREVGYPLLPHGGLLWLVRAALLVAAALHIVTVIELYRISRRARGQGYRRAADLSFSYASRTMRWGGVVLAVFVVYHLMHLTFGNAHPAFDHASPYRNVVRGFSVWWIVLSYAAAVGTLGLHIYHGLWSSTQTLALRSPRLRRWRRPFSAALALAVVAGYLAVPASVLAGWVR